MDPISDLANSFMKFPGIGRRQARRFAYFVMQTNHGFAQKLANQIATIGQHVKRDPESFQHFYATNPNQTQSPISSDPTRNNAVLMVVEKDVDIESIEASGAYHGKYFVLGGLAPLIDTDLEHVIRVPQLVNLIESKSSVGILQEIIFALAANPEGDRTTNLIKQKIAPLQERYGFKISQLGRGFSTGTEVEYSDADTLASALENRK